ncbi:group 1 truncated hemoglobin [Glaciecola sp. MH2013]|uniref:group I truncated hemoglobin n=1 Tax=Glaciecola sp. MH2013 TaxID=2785524 RepID=UPI001E60841E|nr:group 1 truncated hemoglobin [Glaciecola sp. MH2013]
MNKNSTLYEQLGGQNKLEEIADNFVDEISFDAQIYPYFANSNIKRFKNKLVEQLCVMSEGPCQYSGDTMEQVHTGMNITERDFNRTVDLFIAAMTKAGISHPLQNRLLKEMAQTRDQMLYK